MSIAEAYEPIDLRDIDKYPKFYFAGFGRRLSAFIIDSGIYVLMAIAGLHLIVVTFMAPKLKSGVVHIDDFADHLFFLQLSVLALFSLYVIVMHKRRGATIGKIICKIKVVRTDGTPLTYGDTTIRYFPHLILLLLALVVPLNFSQKPTKIVTNKQITLSSSGGISQGISVKGISPAKEAQEYITGTHILWIIGSAVFLARHRQRRAPHDLLAGTAVIKV